jgi:hypothetical protein
MSVLAVRGIDWKGIGYITSIASVFLLGAIAWPKPGDPKWHLVALIAGMATSIVGMGFRYFAHLQQQAEVRRAEAEAREAKDGRANSGGAAARG